MITFGTRHGNDLALEIPVHDVPSALVDREGRQSVISSILICFRHDPRRGVRDTLVIFRVRMSSRVSLDSASDLPGIKPFPLERERAKNA